MCNKIKKLTSSSHILKIFDSSFSLLYSYLDELIRGKLTPPLFQTIQNNMQTVCKCQGISGSCTVKTCYRRTPTLKLVGSELMKKYTYATRVVGWVKEGAGIDWTLYNPKDIKPQASDLVYSDETNQDDFCNRNERIGSLGTVGRICNVTSTNTDNCVDLCCHRGYFTRSRPISFACNCRFEWCCEVKCDNCKKTLQEAICN